MAEGKKMPNSTLRHVPSVDQLLRTDLARELRETIGVKRVTAIARTVTAEIRSSIRENPVENDHSPETLLNQALRKMEQTAKSEGETGIAKVINATGVLLHTNLGRAPLSQAARAAIEAAAGYCNLEYDVATGTRGKRGARVEALLRDLTGAEDALVVNNCAAAALLILSVIARDGETIVSRGELVEIGGDFRVPDVMASSGTRLVEVGTTNRTHLEDYGRAINANTRLIMRVHPSNYRIVGFASSPEISQLAELAHEHKLPLYEDAGSGVLSELSAYGVVDEPAVSDVVASGVDVVSFSGDKLLGSVQAGLIIGRREIVERLRKHPLYRALRSDKLRLAALEATLAAHRREKAAAEIPVFQMLSLTAADVAERAKSVVAQVTPTELELNLESADSAVGGGTAPTTKLQSTVIAVTHRQKSAGELEQQLRRSTPPVIARVSDDKLLIDLRTVLEEDSAALIAALKSL